MIEGWGASVIAGIVAELTALEPGRLMTWRQVDEGTFVTTEGRFELKAVEGGTRLTVSASPSTVGRPPPARAGSRLPLRSSVTAPRA